MAEEKQIFDQGEDCKGGWKESMAGYDEEGFFNTIYITYNNSCVKMNK